jgi:hypothetical protein
MDRELQLAELEKFKDYILKYGRRNLSIKSASGKLQRSFDAQVKVMPNSMRVFFEMEEYGWYQDKGVSGVKQKYNTPFSYKTKMPPPSKLDKWIVRRGLAPRKKGKFTGRSIKSVGFAKSIQFLIARSIYMKGIKPSLWFTKPFEEAFKELPNKLIEKYGLEAEKMIDLIMKENMERYGYK